MPLPKKSAKAAKPAKKTRRLSDLDLPQGGGADAGVVGDAQRCKADDFFAGAWNRKKPTHNVTSSAFDILNAVEDEYRGKPTVLFVVQPQEEEGELYFWLAADETRTAIAERFAEDSTPVINCRFRRIPPKEADHNPYLKIEDVDDDGEEEDVPF